MNGRREFDGAGAAGVELDAAAVAGVDVDVDHRAGSACGSPALHGASRYAPARPLDLAARVRAYVRRTRSQLRGDPTARQFAALRKARLVTIDVFDTALLRSVAQPADVFALTAWRHGQRGGGSVDIRRQAAARGVAETACRRRAAARGDAEVTLPEIYAAFAGVAPAERDRLMAEELATERDVCVGNPELLRLYERIQAAGTPVAFVSDTYFSTAFVDELLRASGYRGAHRVFTSSEWRQTKAGGGLFDVVTSETGVAPASIVHIGDNARSDVENAYRAGFRPLWYIRAPAPPRARPEPADPQAAIAASLLRGIAALPPVTPAGGVTDAPWAAIGAAVAAPVYLGFAQWLRAELREFDPDRVLFCARDGLIVKNVYERLQRACGEGDAGDYFTVSRRVLVFPSFERLGEFELDFLCSSPVPVAVRDFLQRIGLDADRFPAVLGAHGLRADSVIASEDDRARLRRVMTSLGTEILAACAAERDVLLRYLEELGCRSWRRVAVCDVGWHGTLQYALTNVMRAVNDGVVYRGFYLGTSKRAADLESASSTTRGWIWNRGEPKNRMDVQENGREVIELLFTARHASIVGRNAGPPTQPVLDDASTIDVANRIAADAIQAAALAAIDRYIAAFGGTQPAAVPAQTAFDGLVRLIERPSAREVRSLGKLVHVAGFGSTQVGQPLADPPGILPALRNPRAFLAGYHACRWPSGYLSAFFRTWRFAVGLRLFRRWLQRRAR